MKLRTWRDDEFCDENGAATFKMKLIDYADNPWLMENEEPTPPEGKREMRKLSPDEKQKLRETKKAKKAAAGEVWPRYIVPGPIRFHFINWGYNEAVSDLPIETTKTFYSEWFLFT